MAIDFHKALQRQLNRFNLSKDALPNDINKWQDFLIKINQSYLNTDQERYLLERSMEISSGEMKELNSKLEESQQIAALGYWYHNIATNENVWSKELYKLFKLDYDKPVPTIEQIFDLIYEADRSQLKTLVEKAFKEGIDYEAEIRMKTMNDDTNQYRWFYMIGRPKRVVGKPISELTGIAMDITKRKIAEEEIAVLQKQLVTSARRAGMADVATSILHNVGNVLNSVNVSINLINEYINQSDIIKLITAERMLVEHENDIATFISTDIKGKLIPKYLLKYTEKIQSHYDEVKVELKNLTEQISHIKAITEMQRSLSGVSGLMEKVYIAESIDTALKMCDTDSESNEITIKKNFNEAPFILTDNSKLIQILVNLIHNAKDALSENKNVLKKEIEISIIKNTSEFLMITVRDNGIGIEKENLIKIFSFGFTTKPSGHGFGLHSSALAAKELGGKLEAKSAGLGMGTTFELTLPLNLDERRCDNGSKSEFASDYHR